MLRPAMLPILALLLAITSPATFAAGEGKAVGVDPDAAARLNTTNRVLQVGSDISVGETIVTGNSGQVQIVFSDDTRLVVGPRSTLLIETYLMTNNRTVQNLTINALGGSFRFITGNSPKPAYSIKTPTAAIAVRGTEFDLTVTRSQTSVMLFSGAIELCNGNRDCVGLSQRCDIGLASSRQAIVLQRSNLQRADASQSFRYALYQRPLLPDFRVAGANQCVEQGPPQPLVTTSPETNERFNGTQPPP